jgi:hypothetical protein
LMTLSASRLPIARAGIEIVVCGPGNGGGEVSGHGLPRLECDRPIQRHGLPARDC